MIIFLDFLSQVCESKLPHGSFFEYIYKIFKEPNEKLTEYATSLVNSCISVYSTICTQLLPTPVKSHYTFNLRDLSKVFQGILMADIKSVQVNKYIEIIIKPDFKNFFK
jgi:dynein heavy chain